MRGRAGVLRLDLETRGARWALPLRGGIFLSPHPGSGNEGSSLFSSAPLGAGGRGERRGSPRPSAQSAQIWHKASFGLRGGGSPAGGPRPTVRKRTLQPHPLPCRACGPGPGVRICPSVKAGSWVLPGHQVTALRSCKSSAKQQLPGERSEARKRNMIKIEPITATHARRAMIGCLLLV